MPELPDIQVYVLALESRLSGSLLERVRFVSPFLLRSVAPPISAVQGKRVVGIRRLGKRIVFCFQDGLFLVLHLMIAGRLRWRDAGAQPPKRSGLAAFDFSTGTLILTEAGSKRRASLHVVAGEHSLQQHDRGGLEVLEADLAQFRQRLLGERHTLKRALTDPSIFSGIGNAYSDEILHRARLSPFKLATGLDERESASLFEATRSTLQDWIERLRSEAGGGFPERVTAFHPAMAVHGRFGKPCPVCAAPVQRIVYAENEMNYCPGCQTQGRILADRLLSRLLRDDWPARLDEQED